MALSRFHPRFTVRRLMVAVAIVGIGVGGAELYRRNLVTVAANRAIARRQLVVIDEAWAWVLDMAQNSRIEIDGGTVGPWGRRRLEALRRAGADQAEIVAALEKYINDLERLAEILRAADRMSAARATRLGDYEVRFLRMEAEIWLNEEKAW